MALTEDEIRRTLRLKQEIEDTLNSPGVRRMKDDIARGFPVAQEALRIQEHFHRMVPTRSLVEELGRGHEEMKRLVGTTTFADGVRALTTEVAAVGGFSKISSLAEEISRIATRTAPDFGLIASVLKEAQRSTSFVTTLKDALANNPLVQLADEYGTLLSGFRQLATSPQFGALIREARYSGSFAERIAANVAAMTVPELDENDFTVLEDAFGQRVAVLPRGTISLEGANLILSFVFFFLAWYFTNQSEQRMMERMDDLERRMAASFSLLSQQIHERLAPMPEQVEEIRVVVEPLKVRVAPDLDAENVAVLEPGQRVNVVARSESWIEVEYFDGDSGSVRSGWVAELYTKEVSED